ncbi:GNAT family N-acetyltransferase [Paenibacillus sp. MB22_1]|uniref:GNAT family N-acetyltransferase n=1 Tax=Paenibacillus TaxID=44249 RepID=UPI0039A0F02F
MGIGTKVIEWLKNYAQNKGFDRICIENANTDASIGLARKLGFTNVPNSPIIQEVLKTEESPDYHLLIVRS